MSIAILCPTRGRPEQCRRMIESVRSTSGQAKVFIVTDADSLPDYINSLGTLDIDVYPDMLPTAMKWNSLAMKAMATADAKLFMLGSDDMYFDAPGWDKALLDHYNALENKIHVYALADSRDHDGTPHPIVTREYIEALGYFVPPIFLHWFVDSWTVAIAKSNGCFTHLKDYKLIHDKPSDYGVCDETHNRIRQWGWHSRDQWVNDHCQDYLELQKNKLSCALMPHQYQQDKFIEIMERNGLIK